MFFKLYLMIKMKCNLNKINQRTYLSSYKDEDGNTIYLSDINTSD
jgi:hypothetical protein